MRAADSPSNEPVRAPESAAPAAPAAPSRLRPRPGTRPRPAGDDSVAPCTAGEREAAMDALASTLRSGWVFDYSTVEEAFRRGYRPGTHGTEAAYAGLKHLRGMSADRLAEIFHAEARIDYDLDAPAADTPREVIAAALRGLEPHR